MNLQRIIINHLEQLDGYVNKARCLETVEVTLKSVGMYDNETKNFLDTLWNNIEETHVHRIPITA